MPSSTRWRVLATATGSIPVANVCIAEIEMHTSIGGANVCTGGTASASTAQASFAASAAFDASNSTYWASAAVPSQWIEYQFAAAQTIVEFAITAPPGTDHMAAPRDFQLQYFDGSAWVTTISRKFEGFTSSQKRTYSASYPTATKQVWRLNISSVTTENPGIGDLVLRTALGGSNVATGGTPAGTGAFNASYSPAFAFDGSNSTYWYSSNSSPQWISYQFTAAQDIIQYVVSAPIGDQAHAPTAWTLEYYDPIGDTWAVADTRTGQGTWTSGEARTYTLASATVIADTYWRIYVTASYGSTWNQIGCEVEWLNSSAVDLTAPGIAVITSGDESGLGSANLYDNDASTFHQFGSSALPAYSGVYFSSATSAPAVASVSIKAHASWADRMPKTFKIQKSSSGNSNDWADVATFTNVAAWTGNEKRTYALVVSSSAAVATGQAQTAAAVGGTGIAASVTTRQGQSAAASGTVSTAIATATVQAQSTTAAGTVSIAAQVTTSQGQTASGVMAATGTVDAQVATTQAQSAQAAGAIGVAATVTTAQAQTATAAAETGTAGAVSTAQGQSSAAALQTATAAQVATTQAQGSAGVIVAGISGTSATAQTQTTHATGFVANVAAGTLTARINIRLAVQGAPHF